MEKLYSTKELAELLGISKRAIQKRVKAGKLTPAKIDANGYLYFAMPTANRELDNRELRTDNRELRTENRELRTENREPEPRTANQTANCEPTINCEPRTATTPEKTKTAHHEAANPQDKNSKKSKKSQPHFNDINSLKKRKNRDKYETYIRLRKELAKQAKPHIVDLLYELGVENLSKNFRCINPAHNDSTPSMTYYSDTHCVHCHGCGFHGNIFL